MTNKEADFGTWFGIVAVQVLDRCGVDFRDQDSVANDYATGRDAFDVVDEICAEYEFGEED